MNYRAEIDALPEKPEPGDPNYTRKMFRWYSDAFALAARIHAEPHGEDCDIGNPVYTRMVDSEGDQIVGRSYCTCGKDAALTEVLG